MREIARRSGLSPAQISRIEAGAVEAPTMETLTSLARSLERDPQLLLIALGRVDGARALQHVRQALEVMDTTQGDSADLRRELGERQQLVEDFERLQSRLRDEWQTIAAQEDALKAMATELQNEIAHFARMAREERDELEVAAEHRGRAGLRRSQLARVQSELKTVRREGNRVRARLRKHEVALAAEQERLAETVREIAAQSFVESIVPAESELVVLEEMNDLLAGYGKSRERLVHELERVIKTMSTQRVEITGRAVERQVAEMERHLDDAAETLAAQVAEITLKLRNQLAHQPDDADFRRLAAAWGRLTPARRGRVLQFVEDQRRLSLQELLDQGEEVEAIEQTSARTKAK